MARGYPDYEGDKSGLYLKPEWSAKEATDKNFLASGANKAAGAFIFLTYTVPIGKTLYITQAGFMMGVVINANSELNQICKCSVEDTTAGTPFGVSGGNGGGSITFPKPQVIPATHELRVYCINYSNHNADLTVTANGYEV